MSNQTVEEFLRQKEIRWAYILIQENKSLNKIDKTFITYTNLLDLNGQTQINYIGSSKTLKEKALDKLGKYQTEKYYNSLKTIADKNNLTVYIAHSTNKYQIIDIDDEDYIPDFQFFLEKSPYYLSATKKLPHIFCQSKSKNKKFVFGDLLNDSWAWVLPKTKIINYHNDISNIGDNFLKPFLPHLNTREIEIETTKNKNEISDLLKIIDPKFASNRDDWFKIMVAVKNCLQDYNCFDEFSKKSMDKYDPINNKLTWDSVDINQYNYNIGTIRHYAKLSDTEKFNEINKNLPRPHKTYNDIKNEFEKNHFKIVYNACYARIDDEDDKITMIQEKNLNISYKDIHYFNHETQKKERFITRWIDDENKRSYRKIDFIPPPNICPSHTYNLYNGLNVENIPSGGDGDIAVILQHIKNLVNNDDDSYEYFIKWLAHRIQMKGLIRVALLFRSEEGAGKNIFFDWFGNQILGKRYYTTSCDIQDFAGRFAQGLKNKLLVIANEAQGSSTFSLIENIKSSITDETIRFEQKGIDPVFLKNNSAWVFTTNNDTAIKISPSDRRFVCFDCNNDICNQLIYFKNLKSAMDNPNVQYAFYNYLKNIDIDNYDFINNRPKTKLYEMMKQSTVPIVIRFLQEYYDNMENDNDSLPHKELFAMFNDFIRDGKYKSDLTTNKFGRYLDEYNIDKKLIKIDGYVHQQRTINKQKLEIVLRKYII
jgi:hypothetical protein